VTIMYSIQDMDGDEMKQGWTCDRGKLLTNNSDLTIPVLWIAPKILGEHFIKLMLYDHANITEDSVKVHVKDTMGAFVDVRDGHEYSWVKIGSQTWMSENLKWLPSVNPIHEVSYDEPYYYVYDFRGTIVSVAQATNKYETYGVLYNWEAAMISCLAGWHLPSDDEWKTLEKHLGMSSSDVDTTGRRVSGDVGQKLKSKSGWQRNNYENNTSGFNALPGGLYLSSGWFSAIIEYSGFWSSSMASSKSALRRGMHYFYGGVERTYMNLRCGLSVRCVKDE